MATLRQRIIPAARSIKDIETAVHMGFEYLVMLQIHLSQVKYVTQFAHEHKTKIFLHADLIQGLRADESGAQYLCQDVKPDGLISTHAHVVSTAMKRGIIGVQRVFLLDSQSLETTYRVVDSVHPDYLEVLPGLLTPVIREITQKTGLPVLAGGFLRSKEDVNRAIEAGAVAVTTSDHTLWSQMGPGR
ncbi:glycerol-3-phosphate responsive antiterminator [Alicyclobacillus tolerans]|nr:glycerol-3-phosphate responsive antiterminator [Alicyclobacillus tolerans]MCF8567537.1 glycerol-3-phosphate responsive antiterminator [Alicyclobacillus tolerans]